MRAIAMGVATAVAMMLAGCQSTPEGARGPGEYYAVARSYNGFAGTQQLRFGAYRIAMRFDARAQAKSEFKRGLLGDVLGCSNSGCGLPRSPASMPLEFGFTGPAGTQEGRCAQDGHAFRCTLGDVRMQLSAIAGGFGAWDAATPFGPLRVESRDIDNELGRRIEWRVIDRNAQALAVVADSIDENSHREPSFSVWLADGHPEDQQALAMVAGTLLAYAWHSSGS